MPTLYGALHTILNLNQKETYRVRQNETNACHESER